jgi:hypothetical protein
MFVLSCYVPLHESVPVLTGIPFFCYTKPLLTDGTVLRSPFWFSYQQSTAPTDMRRQAIDFPENVVDRVKRRIFIMLATCFSDP